VPNGTPAYRWDRQKGESRQAYAAFVAYRDIGATRTQNKVAAQLGKSSQLMARWSTRWAWIERVDAWDAQLEREAQVAALAEARQRGRDIIKSAQFVQALALQRFKKLHEDPNEIAKVKVRDALSMLVEGVKMEKIERGEPTEIVDAGRKAPPVAGRLDFSKATPEQLDTLEQILSVIETTPEDVQQAMADMTDAEEAERRLTGGAP
jgi:hypothetical protein